MFSLLNLLVILAGGGGGGFLMVNSYPYYPECSDSFDNVVNYENYTILNTLNGKVQGACYNVSVRSSLNDDIINRNVLTWLSIPFAEPPINENRFKTPVEVKSWNDTRDGTEWPNRCMQQESQATPIIEMIVNRTINVTVPDMSEDCLYLNVFVPFDAYKRAVIEKDTTARRPILVFIYGGSFVSGTSSEDVFEPSTFVATKNIILINFNYRVGPLGFLYLSNTLAAGNQGFLDQHLALKWIYNNADLFGGDKTRITISGQSAGSFSVGYHLAYAPSWPYFNNAILQSGSPLIRTFPLLTPESANVRTRGVLSLAGCASNNRTDDDMIKCAQKLDPLLLFNVSNQYLYIFMYNGNIQAAGMEVSVFALVQDNIVFNQSIEDYFKYNQVKSCDLMVGSTSSESGVYAAFSGYFGFSESTWQNAALNYTLLSYVISQSFIYYPCYPNKVKEGFVQQVLDLYVPAEYRTNVSSPILVDFIVQVSTQRLFACPAFELIQYYDRFQNVYVYTYDHRISTTIYPSVFGVVHVDDIPIVYGEPLSIKKQPLTSYNYWTSSVFNYSTSERYFSEQVMSYWTNFVSNNNPNSVNTSTKPDLPCWYSYSQTKNSSSSSSSTPNRCDKIKPGFTYLRLKADSIENLNGYQTDKCKFWTDDATLNSSNSIQK